VSRLLRFVDAAVRSLRYKVAVNGSVMWTGRWIAVSTRLVVRAGGRLNLGHGARIGDHARVIVGPRSELSVGPRTTIERGGEITAISGARVVIGSDTYVGNFCNLRSDERIEIGDGCYFGQFVSIIDGGYNLRSASGVISRNDYQTKAVRVGNNAWVGVGAISLPGVEIGDGAVVGAGAVVTRSIPSRAIAVGNPARVSSMRP